MQEHKLTEVDVSEVADGGSAITELPMGAEGFMADWKFALISNVAKAFFCEALALRVGKRRKVRLIGRKDDIAAAVAVYTYLLKEIERLSSKARPLSLEDALDEIYDVVLGDDEDFVRSYGEVIGLVSQVIDRPAGTSATSKQKKSNNRDRLLDALWDGAIDEDVRSYREKFRMGAAMGACEQLRIQTEVFSRSNEKALVLVNRSKQDVLDHLSAKYGSSLRVNNVVVPDEGAFADGYVAGSQIEAPGRGVQKRLEKKSSA
jgi:hypothetical protein